MTGSANPFEQEQKLRELGLSEYTSRAYLALLRLGTSEARAISRLGRVPVAKIYSTLDQLSERGLCTVAPGPPKRFTPIPIEAYLDRLSAQREAEARAAQDAKVELARLFPIAPSAHTDDRGTFQVLRGRTAVIEKLRILYTGAAHGVLLHAADHMMARRRAALPLFKAARDNGVRLRMLVRMDAETLGGLGDLAGVAELRAKPEGSKSVAVATFDGARALIIHFVPDDGSTINGKDVALYTDEEAIVGALEAFLEAGWASAEPYDEARDRLARGGPRPFWRALPHREAILDATRRLVDDGARGFSGYTTMSPSVARCHRAAMFQLAEDGGSSRYVMRLETADEVSVAEDIMREIPRFEIRHADVGAGMAYSLWDDVALYGFWPADSTDVIPITMTNDFAVVRSLRQHFETAWSDALTTDERREELARYPHLPLRERIQMFETLFDDVPMGITIFDRDLRVVFVNRTGLELRDDRRGDGAGRLAVDLVAELQKEPRYQMAKRVLETGVPERHEFLHPSGKWFESETRRFGKDLLIVTFRDVTEKHDALAQRGSPRLPPAPERLGWSEVDVATDRVRYSPELADMLGLDSAEGTVRMDLVHPDDRGASAKVRELAGDQRGRYEIEWRFRRPEGWVWMRTSAEPVLGADGRVERIFCVVRELGPADG